MKIVYKDTFVERLEMQVEYLSSISIDAAKSFKRQIISHIRKLPEHPYLYRKSIYYEDNQVRDMVVKSYTIIYRVKPDTIEIIGFRRFQNTPFESYQSKYDD